MLFDGVLPPLPTPFTDDAIDTKPLPFTIGALVAGGVRGVLAMGSNGEAAYVSQDEADRLVEAVRECLPADRTLLVGTGRDSTVATIEACRRAAALGADAVLVRPPTAFVSLMTEPALDAHYRAVADASPVPVMLYNQPAAFGVSLQAPFVARLSTHPNVCGIKESSGLVGLVGEHVHGLPAGAAVVTGVASTMYASLLVGATGLIVAVGNVVPALCVRLYDLVKAGALDEALRLQHAITPLGHAVTARFGVPGLKAAMTLAGHMDTAPRRPLLPASAEAVEAIRALMARLEEDAQTPVLRATA
jgi:4-hydroxy-2-oxoglutarate aldolase